MEIINCPHDEMDERLQKAANDALKTHQLLPILKEEIRLSILHKRLSEGKEEIEASFLPPVSYELTPEEKEKRKRRQHQNRLAARKHRRKSKTKTLSLEQELEHQKDIKQRLVAECSRLSEEKELLVGALLTKHNGIAVSCDQCETRANVTGPIDLRLTVTGTITVDSSIFTSINWQGANSVRPEPNE